MDGVPIVVDADALALSRGRSTVPAVLTPHAGELARMTGADARTIEAAPLHHAREAAERYDAVVLLKGRHTSSPAGRPGPDHHHRRAVAGHRRGRRRARRTDRRAAGRGAGRRTTPPASARGCTAPPRRTPPRAARSPRPTWRGRSPRWCATCSEKSRHGMRPEIVVDLDAIRHNVRTLKDLVAPAAMMTVVKADGYGHGIVESRPGRACRVARTGSAWRPSPRRSPCGRRATTARCCAGSRCPPTSSTGRSTRAVERGRRRDGVHRRAARPDRRRRREPAASSSRSTPACPAAAPPSPTGRRSWRGRPSTSGNGRARITGVWSHFACSDEPEHPANDEQQPRFEDALADRRGRRAAPRGPPPRELGRRDPAARAAGTTWCASAWRRTASTPPPTSATAPTCAPR